ncbi:MAG: Pyridoxamine 5-phosphate oxidase [Segetibacter sp.]|jgi:pyridoxamine 5'-phosphate oxidase|nr:Pyridoxamine 5-phosphate oxidase [Segetibacter sp.]
MNQSIADIRRDYKLQSLMEIDIASTPIEQFTKWWNEALQSHITEVNAMTLATSTKDGVPSARIVLLKGYNDDGFVFFTNYESAKGQQIADNNKVALVFFWKELERQVRIEGTAIKIDLVESDEYFLSRPTGSQVGAWASPQSKVIESREAIEERYLAFSEKFKAEVLTRPLHWGGYRIEPNKIEFWQGRSSRLHDRILYTKENAAWKIERLAP